MSYDVCRHGGLRRKCETCDLAEELAEANRDKAEMRGWLVVLQWGTRRADWFCGPCQRYHTEGHHPECRLAALLKRLG